MLLVWKRLLGAERWLDLSGGLNPEPCLPPATLCLQLGVNRLTLDESRLLFH